MELMSSATESCASQPTRAGSRPYFVGPGAQIEVAGKTLHDPLIYVADCESVRGADASLLCRFRAIAPSQAESPGALGYWPKLNELRPHQVGTYLAWLEDGRRDPGVDIGYVFLYFYGLEWRTLIDGEDIVSVAKEVLRLLGIYGQSRSFRNYATGLVAHLVMTGRLKPTQKLLSRLVDLQAAHIEDSLHMLLVGFLARERQPLPVTWAMSLASQDVRARGSSVAERAPEEFENLFTKGYQHSFGLGVVPTPGNHDTVLSYRAASPSLLPGTQAAAKIMAAHWPTVQGWGAQFTPVVNLWNECVDKLRSFASKVTREGRDSSRAFEALPDELREDKKHPLQSAWDGLLAEFSPTSGVIILPVSRLASLRGIERRPRLTLPQSRELASLAEMLGTPLEPDARYMGRSYDWDGHLAALRLPEEPVLPETPNYYLSTILLRLAVEVARADGQVDADERRVIGEFLGERFALSWNERLRLNGFLEVLLHAGDSLSGLKKTLSSRFSEDQRKAIGKFLLMVASASKGVSAEEVSALERSFKALGIDPGLVSKYLQDQPVSGPTRPVSVSAAVADGGETIPHEGELDLNRIRSLRAETEEVASMLLTAMTSSAPNLEPEEELAAVADTLPPARDPEAAPSAPLPATPTGGLFDELRASLRPLLEEILDRPKWDNADFDALARRHGTTSAAAIEEINGWADEVLGDFLIEEGATLEIHVHLMEQARKA
jgi:uncharacterized tellurite resistance protein B-like protein